MGNGSLFPESHVPREGGDPEAFRTDRWLALIWIPAFAGNAAEREGTILVLRQAQDEDDCEYLASLSRLCERSEATQGADADLR